MKERLITEVLTDKKTGYFTINILYPSGQTLYSESVIPSDYPLRLAILKSKWGIL